MNLAENEPDLSEDDFFTEALRKDGALMAKAEAVDIVHNYYCSQSRLTFDHG